MAELDRPVRVHYLDDGAGGSFGRLPARAVTSSSQWAMFDDDGGQHWPFQAPCTVAPGPIGGLVGGSDRYAIVTIDAAAAGWRVGTNTDNIPAGWPAVLVLIRPGVPLQFMVGYMAGSAVQAGNVRNVSGGGAALSMVLYKVPVLAGTHLPSFVDVIRDGLALADGTPVRSTEQVTPGPFRSGPFEGRYQFGVPHNTVGAPLWYFVVPQFRELVRVEGRIVTSRRDFRTACDEAGEGPWQDITADWRTLPAYPDHYVYAGPLGVLRDAECVDNLELRVWTSGEGDRPFRYSDAFGDPAQGDPAPDCFWTPYAPLGYPRDADVWATYADTGVAELTIGSGRAALESVPFLRRTWRIRYDRRFIGSTVQTIEHEGVAWEVESVAELEPRRRMLEVESKRELP